MKEKVQIFDILKQEKTQQLFHNIKKNIKKNRDVEKSTLEYFSISKLRKKIICIVKKY